jgi:ribonuclease HI
MNVPIVYSDSNYCVQTFNEWMFNWARNGWIKSDKKVPENLDLIQAYYDWYQKGYRIDLRKIKGHAGHKWNEMADDLATGKIKPTKENENG